MRKMSTNDHISGGLSCITTGRTANNYHNAIKLSSYSCIYVTSFGITSSQFSCMLNDLGIWGCCVSRLLSLCYGADAGRQIYVYQSLALSAFFCIPIATRRRHCNYVTSCLTVFIQTNRRAVMSAECKCCI